MRRVVAVALPDSCSRCSRGESGEALDLRALGNDLGMKDGRRALPGGALLVVAAVPFLHGHIYWPAGGLAMVGVGLGCGLLAPRPPRPTGRRMYRVVVDPLAADQIAMLPRQAMVDYAQALDALELAPWIGAAHHEDNPREIHVLVVQLLG